MSSFKIKNKEKFFLIILIIIHSYSFSFSNILMSPYLQAVTQNSITVMVESDSKNPVMAIFGEKGQYTRIESTKEIKETGAKPTTYVHRIILDKLKEFSDYNYKVIQGVDTLKGGTFKTAAGKGRSYQMALSGDNRSGTKYWIENLKGLNTYTPAFAIFNGDLCYDGSYDLYKKEFFVEEAQKLFSHVPFFSPVGNHEGWRQNTKAFTTYPTIEKNTDAYYSFDYGDIHFLILNTEEKYDKSSPQWKFAEEDLKNSSQKWKIVCCHKPAYCGGGHNSDKNMIKMSEQIFEPNNVDFVFGGHSHFYQHNKINNIHHFVFGGAGAPLYEPKDESYTIKSVKKYHYAILDITPNSIKMRVIDYQGNEIDNLEFKK